MKQIASSQALAYAIVNENFDTLSHQAVYGKNQETTTGLTWGYYGGRWGGFSVADGTLSLTASSANYVVVAIATGVISVSTASTNWDNATDYVRVYKITTGTSTVSSVEDHRVGPRGVHGGAGGGGSGVTDGDKGDVTVSASGATWTIDEGAVTYAKMQDVSAASKLLGRGDSGSGDPQEITLGTGLTMTGTTLSASGGGGGGGTKTYAVFTPMTSQPPASNFATLDTRNSIAVLDFDAATQESVFWVSVMPEAASLASGLKIRIQWMATSATSGDVVWGAQIERMNTDLDTDSYDTAATATGTANATSGIPTTTEITLTTIDSVAAGELFRVSVYRKAADAADTMTGDAELIAVEVRSAA